MVKPKVLVALLVVIIVVLGVSLTYVLFSKPTAPAGPATVVRMGVSPWSSLSSMYTTYEEIVDMWEEIEAKYNVEFQWNWTEEDASTMFYGGSDFAVLGALETAEFKFNRGFEGYTFGNIVWNEDALVVSGDAPYTSPVDMVGEKLANFGFDSGAYKYAEVLWKREFDINATEDFEWVVAPPDVCVELVRTGEVEGALVYGGPWAVGLADYGMKLLYGPYTEEARRLTGKTAIAIEAMMIRKDLADAHPEVPKAILEGWEGIYNFMAADVDTIYEKFLEVSYGLNAEQAAVFTEIYPFDMHMAEPGPLTDEQIDADFEIIQWAYEGGLIENPPTKEIFLKVQL